MRLGTEMAVKAPQVTVTCRKVSKLLSSWVSISSAPMFSKSDGVFWSKGTWDSWKIGKEQLKGQPEPAAPLRPP